MPETKTMPETFGNYINGEWVTRPAVFENRNPANTDEIVGNRSHPTRVSSRQGGAI